jgi:uncharacterized membrane protein
LIYAGIWPDWLLYSLGFAGLIAIAIVLFRQRHSLAPHRLFIIGVLQVAMLAVVLWVLRIPTLTTERLRDGQNSVALVLDASASMSYGAESTRLDAARDALAAAADTGDAPAVSVRRYEMSAAANAVDSFDASEPGGDQTDIAASLISVLRESRSDSLAAVLLASDGIDTSARIDEQQMAEIAGFGVPVHTIPVGRALMPEDLELMSVVAPEQVLPNSTMSARVSIRHDQAGETRLKVYDGEQLLASQPIALGPDTNTTTAWVDLSIATPGPHRLDYTLEASDGEQELRNNTRSSLVNVADENYRVLYFEGEPRWEYKFLRRAVQPDDELQIVSLLRVSPNKFYRQGIETPEQLEDGFPATREELFAYDALIIGSVEAASLSPEQQQNVRDFVSERGGSLLMIAGPNGLGNGGWGQTVVGDVLPARLPPSTQSTFVRQKVPASMTPHGSDSQLLRLAADPDDNRQAWLNLPEVADYQRVGTLKPAAVVLLTVATVTDSLPLLATQPFGRGHSYILATGGTWRWQMSMPVEDQSHETFWRQLLRTLVASAPRSTSLAATDRTGVTGVALRAEFREEDFTPMQNIGVTAVVSHEDGATLNVGLEPSVAEPGIYHASFEPDTSGTWYVEAVAERDGEPVSTARASIHHELGQAEYFNIRSNPNLLQRIAEATGGRSLAIDEVDAVGDLLRYSSSGITEREYRPVWDALAVFLLLILLKAGEWLLRRRWSTI